MRLNEQISRIKNMMKIIKESQYFTKKLDLDLIDDEVKMLQSILKIDETGNFDEETENCVKEFQTFTNIKIDGIVGPQTRGKLNDFLDNKILDWKGCKKTPIENLDKNNLENVKTVVTPDKIVGNSWRSCNAFSQSGGLNKWGDKFNVSATQNGFSITYKGPSSGLSIAHASKGGDTIHQTYNVLICLINPYLAQGNLKPDISNIKVNGKGSGKNSELNIFVPFIKTDGVYQLDRRGGWGHDPGPSKMSNKCKKVNGSNKICEGPVKNVAQGTFGKITEYFITHEI